MKLLSKLKIWIWAMAATVVFLDFAQAETAKVLPKGIHRARVVSVFTNGVIDKFNEDGLLEPLSSALNRSVTIQDFVAKQPELGALVNFLNAQSPGLGNELLNTNLFSDFSLSVKSYMPAIERGITDRLTIGARIPVVNRSVVNNFNVESTNNALAIAQLVGGLSPAVADGLINISNQPFDTNFFANSLFASKGYEVPSDFTSTDLGDLEFGGKYNFYKTDRLYLTSQLGFRVPTGTDPSLTNLADKGTSNGAWAASTAMFQEIFFNKHLSVNFFEKFVYNFPDTKERAVPRDADDDLPSLLPEDGQVQNVTRYQGIQLEFEVAANLKFFEESVLGNVGLRYKRQGESVFDGPGLLFYEKLSENTNTSQWNSEFSVAYSTIPAFRKKQFSVPLQLKLVYNTTLTGTNVPLVNYFRTDLIMFF